MLRLYTIIVSSKKQVLSWISDQELSDNLFHHRDENNSVSYNMAIKQTFGWACTLRNSVNFVHLTYYMWLRSSCVIPHRAMCHQTCTNSDSESCRVFSPGSWDMDEEYNNIIRQISIDDTQQQCAYVCTFITLITFCIPSSMGQVGA